MIKSIASPTEKLLYISPPSDLWERLLTIYITLQQYKMYLNFDKPVSGNTEMEGFFLAAHLAESQVVQLYMMGRSLTHTLQQIVGQISQFSY